MSLCALGAAGVGGAEIGEYKIRGNTCYGAGHLQEVGGDDESGELGVPGSLYMRAESR